MQFEVQKHKFITQPKIKNKNQHKIAKISSHHFKEKSSFTPSHVFLQNLITPTRIPFSSCNS